MVSKKYKLMKNLHSIQFKNKKPILSSKCKSNKLNKKLTKMSANILTIPRN